MTRSKGTLARPPLLTCSHPCPSVSLLSCRCAKRSVRTPDPETPPSPRGAEPHVVPPRPFPVAAGRLSLPFPLRAALPSPSPPPPPQPQTHGRRGCQVSPTTRETADVRLLRPMAAAAPVAPGSGCLSRPRPRPPWVRLRGARVAAAAAAAAEGPSCLYVGPIETASQEKLEALYDQARDSYYSGQPLIVDDMFDKVELKLRLYGSKSVVKYPRCSLIRQSTYADAEEDQAMFMALSSIWMLLLLFGTSAFLVPSLYTLSIAFGDVFGARHLLYGDKSLDAITRVNDLVLVGLGFVVGYPIASASVGALQGLLTNNLVALKGSCPNCGEQVFAFVNTDKSVRAPHRAECHVCECPLEYRTKIEKSLSGPRRSWVYGRVYLVKQGHPRKRKWIND